MGTRTLLSFSSLYTYYYANISYSTPGTTAYEKHLHDAKK
jgi:hypothetical protein